MLSALPACSYYFYCCAFHTCSRMHQCRSGCPAQTYKLAGLPGVCIWWCASVCSLYACVCVALRFSWWVASLSRTSWPAVQGTMVASDPQPVGDPGRWRHSHKSMDTEHVEAFRRHRHITCCLPAHCLPRCPPPLQRLCSLSSANCSHGNKEKLSAFIKQKTFKQWSSHCRSQAVFSIAIFFSHTSNTHFSLMFWRSFCEKLSSFLPRSEAPMIEEQNNERLAYNP